MSAKDAMEYVDENTIGVFVYVHPNMRSVLVTALMSRS